ncbi:MAG TPA: ATP-binding protein, partial [Minicystis sp.]|nr:ATP-binding protein [Minicystis sp.]
VTIAAGMTARGDASLVRAVLENLLGNAFKFTTRTDAPRVEVGCRDDAGERVFFVRDNGAGFDMKYAAKLFAPFQRLHATKEFAGTGVGLATVQRIVNRHGGRIWCAAKPGEGATFSFTLAPAPASRDGR